MLREPTASSDRRIFMDGQMMGSFQILQTESLSFAIRVVNIGDFQS